MFARRLRRGELTKILTLWVTRYVLQGYPSARDLNSPSIRQRVPLVWAVPAADWEGAAGLSVRTDLSGLARESMCRMPGAFPTSPAAN